MFERIEIHLLIDSSFNLTIIEFFFLIDPSLLHCIIG